MRKQNLLSLLLVLIMTKSLTAQIMLKEVFLGEQIEKSSLVIEGKVLSKASYWNVEHERIYTANTVEVYKVFKGEAASKVEILTLGGVVGFDAQIVNPSLNLNVGDVGVFTLYESHISLDIEAPLAQKYFKPYGSLQGFYKYDLGKDVVANKFTTKEGIRTSFYQDIMYHTRSNYTTTSNNSLFNNTFNRDIANKAANVLISSFSPIESSAGTKSVLTINGSNFGEKKGKVAFANADNAGSSYVKALDTQVLTWTNSQITVEIPSEAGTGKIKVIHDDGTETITNTNLKILYAQANIVSDKLNPGVMVAYPIQLVDDNGTGGYTWHMTSSFSGVSGAKDAFLNALNTWSCQTQINWDLEENNLVTNAGAQHKSIPDGMNSLTFDNSSSTDPDENLPDTVLGLRTSYYSFCPVNKNGVETLEWYVKEFDIVFDDETNWSFVSGDPNQSEFDFESVALHELGHCRQLDHVINTNNVMHYAIAAGEILRGLSDNNITLANIIQDNNTSIPVCNERLVSDFSGDCSSLGVDEDKLNEGVNVYPNPSRGRLFINTDNSIRLVKADLHDVNGRLISEFDLSNSSEKNTIDLSHVAKGVYFMNVFSDVTFITKKIILE
jgi:hypothetical protein